MDIDVASLFKQGGVALVALGLLAYIVKRIGERMITSIDKLAERSDTNAKEVSGFLTASTTLLTSSMNRQSDVTAAALGGTAVALGSLTERVASVEGRIAGIASRDFDEDAQTPVEGPHRKSATPAHGNPVLPYGIKPIRPKTNG